MSRADVKSPNCGEGAFGGNPCLAPPHVRGEDNAKTGQARPERETPPRAWGRLEHQPAGDLDLGNTPTCVGKTPHWPRKCPCPWKHPHVRGEDIQRINNTGTGRETPPRAWGRPMKAPEVGGAGGNTPTCVGKTPRATGWKRKRWKHPHVRGEDCRYGGNSNDNQETPPRAWGRRRRMRLPTGFLRNTPTCVGKTNRVMLTAPDEKKHPHVRGEDGMTVDDAP